LRIRSHHLPHGTAKQIFARLAPSLVVFVSLAIFLGVVLERRVETLKREGNVRKSLESSLAFIPGASLGEVNMIEKENAFHVVATVRVPQPITPENVKQLESDLGSLLSRPVRVTIRSTLNKVATSAGYLYEPEELKVVLDEPASATPIPLPDSGASQDSLARDTLNSAKDSMNSLQTIQ
jgi:hypothetical protein